MKIKEYIKQAHDTAVEKGFYDCCECVGVGSVETGNHYQLTHDIKTCVACNGTGKTQTKNIGELLMLVVSELGEALEAHRCGRFADWENFIHSKDEDNILDFSYSDNVTDFEVLVKDTLEDEIADVFIRLFDLCGYLEIEPEDFPHGVACTENVGEGLLEITDMVCKFYHDKDHSWRQESMKDILDHLEYFCNHHNIPIEKHIEAKMAYNKTRPKKHGKEY